MSITVAKSYSITETSLSIRSIHVINVQCYSQVLSIYLFTYLIPLTDIYVQQHKKILSTTANLNTEKLYNTYVYQQCHDEPYR